MLLKLRPPVACCFPGSGSCSEATLCLSSNSASMLCPNSLEPSCLCDPLIQRSWMCQRSWESSCPWVWVEWMGSQSPGSAPGTGEAGRNPCIWLGRGLCSLGSCGGPSYAWCWETCCILNCDLECVGAPLILGVSDFLEIELPLLIL